MHHWKALPLSALPKHTVRAPSHSAFPPPSPYLSAHHLAGAAALPDFLAPALRQDQRRKTTSLAYQHLACLPARSSTGSTYSPFTWTTDDAASQAVQSTSDTLHAPGPSRCPAPHDTAATMSSSSSSTSQPAAESIGQPMTVAEITAETPWQDLLALLDHGSAPLRVRIDEMLLSQPFVAERNAVELQESSIGWRHLHGRLLYALLVRRSKRKSALAPARDAAADTRQPRWNRAAAATFHSMLDLVPPGSLQLHFLADLADFAGEARYRSSLEEIQAAAQDVLSTPRWRQRLRLYTGAAKKRRSMAVHHGSRAARAADDDVQMQESHTHLARVGRVFLSLMFAYARIGRYDRVSGLFEALLATGAPATIKHFQLQLMALFATQLDDKSMLDGRLLSAQVSRKVSELRSCMDLHGVEQDDTFLATVLHGLGTPLRNPQKWTPRTVASFVEVQRSIADAYLEKAGAVPVARSSSSRGLASWNSDGDGGGGGGSETSLAARCASSRQTLTALIQGELDALESAIVEDDARRYHRIRHLVQCLATSQGVADTIKAERPSARDSAMAAYIKARILLHQGRLEQAIKSLPLFLGKPLRPSRFDGVQQQHRDREDILRRRSIVILLFSSAVELRQSYPRRDYALDVLDTAIRHDSFTEIWGERIERRRLHTEKGVAYDGVQTWLRLWKRYLGAWTADVQQGRASVRSRASMEPWKSLRTCLASIEVMSDKLYPAYTPTPSSGGGGGGAGVRRPRSLNGILPPADRTTIRTMLHAAAVGGRYSANGPEEQVERIEKVFTLFAAARARLQTWEIVRSVLLDLHSKSRREGRRGEVIGQEAFERILASLDRYSDSGGGAGGGDVVTQSQSGRRVHHHDPPTVAAADEDENVGDAPATTSEEEEDPIHAPPGEGREGL